MKLIDLLVALTVSEEKMYPLIQAYVWTKIGREPRLLKKVQYIYIWYWVHGWNSALFSAHLQVLHSFFRMGVSEGLGNRKVEVLADTAVTLEQGEDGLVASEVIQKLLSVSAEIQLCMHVCR